MKKNFMLSAFSLMEMMIVLLIVAIIAAASAPMISKKMMRQTGTGDSPWLFTGSGNNIVFNGNGNADDTVFIGASGLATDNWGLPENYVNNRVTRINFSPMIVASTQNQEGDNPPCLTFADRHNRIMGHMGMTRSTIYFANIIPQETMGNDDSSIVIGTGIQAHGIPRQNAAHGENVINNKIMIGHDINYDCIRDTHWRNHDIIFGTHIGTQGRLIPAFSDQETLNANIFIGTDIQNDNAMGISSTAAIGSHIRFRGDGLVAAGDTTNGIVVGDSAGLGAGDGSIAFGYSSRARGNNAIAIGNHAHATDNNVIAIGNNAQNNGNNVGPILLAAPRNAISIGNNARSVRDSITIGNHAHDDNYNNITGAKGRWSIAIGDSALTNHQRAIAIGQEAQATGRDSVALGHGAVASGVNSVAIGAGVTASANQIVLGKNDPDNSIVTMVVIPGTLQYRDDVVEIEDETGYLKASPTSDIRLKNVGEKLTSGLEDIKKLEFFNYTYKNDKEQKPHVGVMAQDLQKVFPISVTEGSDGYLTIRWDEMFYSALNAIKELDNKITELKNKVVAYFNRIEKLEAQIDEQQKTIQELKAQNAEFKKRLAKIEKKRGLNKGVNKEVNKEASSTATMGTNPKLSESEAE